MEFINIAITSGKVENEEGLPINYDLYAPISGGSKEFPVILFLPGFKGFKDWGPFPDACEELASTGFCVIAINFSHNGIGEGKTEYQRLDLFEKNTLSSDLEDVKTVIDALQAGEIKTAHASLNIDELGIIGHSRGGHTAIVAAVENESIQCLVTWAAVADCLSRISDQEKKDWAEKGYTEYENSRTNQLMRVNKTYFDDLTQNADKLVALRRAKHLAIPSLFIHGREDETVPQADAEQLHIACMAKEKELRFIPKAGHTFGGTHPFVDDFFPKEFAELLDITSGWFSQHLRK